MATAAQLIARRLYEAGCRHAFGIPGGEVLTIVDALEEAGIEFRLAKHENSAGFMAEGVWHSTGAPGVLVATLGPGVANAINVVANAWQDRVPLIFLTGCVDPHEAALYTHQVFDHNALLKPVTKASLTVVPGAADILADKAMAFALDGQPGPVHLDVPISVASAEESGSDPVRRAVPAPVAPAAGAALDLAREWFQSATRPLIIAGVDVLNQRGEARLREVVEHFGIPLLTTYKAKGILPEDHPLALGGAGLSPKADEILLPLVAESDCIILAGYDPIEMRAGWCSPWPDVSHVIEFSAVHNTHYVHHSRLNFVCDVAAGLEQLVTGAEVRPNWAIDGDPPVARDALRAFFSASEAWGPAAVIETAREMLPRDTVATADSGAHRILLSQMWSCYAPRTLLQSTGLCTMGCALPLATGAKLADPSRPVAAFMGDAGLEMVMGELSTLRDANVPVLVFVFVDESLALIELKQRRMGLDNAGVDFEATDFPAVAKGFGLNGVWVDSRGALEQAITEALASERSTVLACRIPRKAYDGLF